MGHHLDKADWLAVVTGLVECLVKSGENEVQIRMQTLVPVAQAMPLIHRCSINKNIHCIRFLFMLLTDP